MTKLIRVGGTPASRATGDENAPQFLPHGGRGFAADTLLAFEYLGLDLVVAELQLPSLMIELDDLSGGVQLRVEEKLCR